MISRFSYLKVVGIRLIIHFCEFDKLNLMPWESCSPMALMFLKYYLFFLLQVSFNETVRLNIKWSGVESLSTLK